MTDTVNMAPSIAEAIAKIESFVLQTTGKSPTPEELSSALTRYFVLKEISDFINMSRMEGGKDGHTT